MLTFPAQMGEPVSRQRTVSSSEGGWKALYPLLHPSRSTPGSFAPTWEVSHSSALKWNFEPSSAAGMSSVSCPDKAGRVQASFLSKDEI